MDRFDYRILSKLHARKNRILRVWPGSAPSKSRRLLLLSQYDEHGMIHPYLVEMLSRFFYDLDVDIVLLCSGGYPKDHEVAKVQPFCTEIIYRTNFGKDFGAWKHYIQLQSDRLLSYETLILANDSVYGPFNNFCNYIKDIEERDEPVLAGISDSWAPVYHLQSYFLVFNSPLIRSSVFSSFWNSIRYTNARQYIVDKGEIGLSRYCLINNVNLMALCRYENVGSYLKLRFEKERHYPVNPMSKLWKEQILYNKCPFVKCETLKRNYDRVSISELPLVINEVSKYDPELIRSHLRFVASGSYI